MLLTDALHLQLQLPSHCCYQFALLAELHAGAVVAAAAALTAAFLAVGLFRSSSRLLTASVVDCE